MLKSSFLKKRSIKLVFGGFFRLVFKNVVTLIGFRPPLRHFSLNIVHDPHGLIGRLTFTACCYGERHPKSGEAQKSTCRKRHKKTRQLRRHEPNKRPLERKNEKNEKNESTRPSWCPTSGWSQASTERSQWILAATIWTWNGLSFEFWFHLQKLSVSDCLLFSVYCMYIGLCGWPWEWPPQDQLMQAALGLGILCAFADLSAMGVNRCIFSCWGACLFPRWKRRQDDRQVFDFTHLQALGALPYSGLRCDYSWVSSSWATSTFSGKELYTEWANAIVTWASKA